MIVATVNLRITSLRRMLRKFGLPALLLGFVLLATLLSGGKFIQPDNLSVILFQSSIVGVLVIGITFVMLTGGIDLSIVGIMVLSAILMGAAGSERQQMMLLNDIVPYVGPFWALVMALIVAALLGFLNGVISIRFGIPSFIVTLAMGLMLAGVALMVTGGSPIYYPPDFYEIFGETRIFGVVAPVYAFLGLAAVSWWVLKSTRFGVSVYALGGNPHASQLSGIPVVRYQILAFTICGLIAGIAGVLFLSRTGFVAPSSGGDLLLGTIAAVVVGGVSLAGGKGTIVGAVVGVLFLSSLSNLMNILLISPHIQDAISGFFILGAITLSNRIES